MMLRQKSGLAHRTDAPGPDAMPEAGEAPSAYETFGFRHFPQSEKMETAPQITAAPRMSGPASASPYKLFRDTRFFGSLDGLRAISIMGVVWIHASIASPYYSRISTMPILSMGAFGVDIFFVISGFLITTLLLREKGKNGKVSLREFYIRRTLRIWPLYYAVLGFYALAALVFYRHSPRGPEFFHYLPGYITFTYTWFAFRFAIKPIFNFAWSLSVEEQFYTLWAPTLRFLDARWPPLIMLSLIVARVAAGYGLLGHVLPVDSLILRVVTNISVSICFGVLLALVLHSKPGFHRLYLTLGHKWSAPASLLLMVVCLSAGAKWWLLQSATLFALIGACVIREDNGLARWLQFRPLAFIGTISYGIYMLNTLVVDSLRPIFDRLGVRHPMLTFVPFLGGSILLAALSYRHLESPFLALKTRLARAVSHLPKCQMNIRPKVTLSPTR
jgi:peptidoglycan/LPS O-acetylase OafA/YrhL